VLIESLFCRSPGNKNPLLRCGRKALCVQSQRISCYWCCYMGHAIHGHFISGNMSHVLCIGRGIAAGQLSVHGGSYELSTSFMASKLNGIIDIRVTASGHVKLKLVRIVARERERERERQTEHIRISTVSLASCSWSTRVMKSDAHFLVFRLPRSGRRLGTHRHSKDHWVSAICPSSAVLNTRKQHFGNWPSLCNI
jgi:hypothetical protein